MEKAEAYDERFEEVGWGHTTCEGGEQGSASFCGVAGGKGLNQGESGLPKHVPNPVSGKRATGGGPDTESFCRQSPEVGAGWFNDHVRICAGGAQQCAFLPQQRGVRRNPYSYRNCGAAGHAVQFAAHASDPLDRNATASGALTAASTRSSSRARCAGSNAGRGSLTTS